MSDENVNQDIVQPEIKEEVASNAEETTPKPDAPAEETSGTEEAPSPLEPGGERFKQVWARAKSAEAELNHLKVESQREREERIRLEERLKSLEERKQEAPKLTWANYQAAIDAGQISQADAMTRWTEQVQKEAEERALRAVEERQRTTSKVAAVAGEIARYRKAIPELDQFGTEARTKVEREFAYLVDKGSDKSLVTELAALRAAHGDIDHVERAQAAKRTTTKEPFMETHSSTHKPQNNTKDPIKNLDEARRKHYERMIERGRYSGWDEVRKELEYQPPSLRYARG